MMFNSVGASAVDFACVPAPPVHIRTALLVPRMFCLFFAGRPLSTYYIVKGHRTYLFVGRRIFLSIKLNGYKQSIMVLAFA